LLTLYARFRHIFFIDANSEQSIESGIVTKVKSLGLTYSRSSASEALEVLSHPDYEITRDWAIIYDNADNPEINIGRYFPSCAFGTIIITTRNPNLGTLAPEAHIKLDVMSEEESVEVLLRSAIDPSRVPTEEEQDEAREIAKELGYLPVALAHAGDFIKVHNCMLKYRERLRRRRPDILGRPAKYQLGAHSGLHAVLNFTWPHLTPCAQNLMCILGFVSYTGFPIVLLYRAAARRFCFEPFQLRDRSTSFQETVQLLCNTFCPREDWGEQDVDDLVAELEQYSLVARVAMFNFPILRLHPLVHCWTHDRLSQELKEMYRAAAVRLLVCGTGSDDDDIYDFIYPHIVVMFNQLEHLHINDQAGLAIVVARHGARNTAIQLWEGIRASLLAAHGRDHPCTTEAGLQLALLYWDDETASQHGTAIILEKEAVEIRKRTLGPEHPDTLRAVVQQACRDTYTCRPKVGNRKGSYGISWPISAEVSEKALQDALDAWKRQPGDNWEAILETKEKLALSYENETSFILSLEVIEERMERNGVDHTATLRAMERLAQKCNFIHAFSAGGADALELAEAAWTSIVQARIRRRGIEHLDTIHAMENLGWFYRCSRRYRISLDLWREVVRVRQAIQGVDHDDTMEAMSELATLYARCGYYTESELRLKKIGNLKKQTHGSSHDHTLHTMQTVAIMYEDSGRWTEAAIRWKERVEVLKQVRGPSHCHTLHSMVRLAKMYERAEQDAESEAQWKEIVGVVWKAHGSGHGGRLKATKQVAGIYTRTGKYADAEREWKSLIQLTGKEDGPRLADTLEAMKLLVATYESMERYTEATVQCKEILDLIKGLHDSSQKEMLDAMRELAYIYRKAKLYTEAVVQWKEILDVLEVNESGHHETLRAMEALAESYQYAGQYAESETQRKEIVRVIGQGSGPSHWETLDAMNNLAGLYQCCEKYEEAEMVLVSAMDYLIEDEVPATYLIKARLKESLQQVRSEIARVKAGPSNQLDENASGDEGISSELDGNVTEGEEIVSIVHLTGYRELSSTYCKCGMVHPRAGLYPNVTDWTSTTQPRADYNPKSPPLLDLDPQSPLHQSRPLSLRPFFSLLFAHCSHGSLGIPL
jgi:tetratricopeptide (TPR) repeat protein